MRIRAMIAALAVACSLALCAVTAFADDVPEVTISVDYPDVSMTVSQDLGFNMPVYGVYRTEDGLNIFFAGNPTSGHTYWQVYYDGDYHDSTVPANHPIVIDDDSGITYVRAYYYLEIDGDYTYYNVRFQIIDPGNNNNMSGVFGVASEGIHNVIAWIGSWITAITSNSVLLFFCFALALLTIGITICKRLLSTRA